MKKSQFADFVGIAPSMVTKYAKDALIVYSAPKVVDARATLAALAGRLDEAKRLAALARLDAGDTTPIANDAPPAPVPSPETRNAKVALDELKRDAVALDLAKRAGDVIPIADVEAVMQDAIGALQAAFDVEARQTADKLTIDLGLAADRNAMLMRQLRSLCTRARARFAAALAELAGDAPDAGVEVEDAEQA